MGHFALQFSLVKCSFTGLTCRESNVMYIGHEKRKKNVEKRLFVMASMAVAGANEWDYVNHNLIFNYANV